MSINIEFDPLEVSRSVPCVFCYGEVPSEGVDEKGNTVMTKHGIICTLSSDGTSSIAIDHG